MHTEAYLFSFVVPFVDDIHLQIGGLKLLGTGKDSNKPFNIERACLVIPAFLLPGTPTWVHYIIT